MKFKWYTGLSIASNPIVVHHGSLIKFKNSALLILYRTEQGTQPSIDTHQSMNHLITTESSTQIYLDHHVLYFTFQSLSDVSYSSFQYSYAFVSAKNLLSNLKNYIVRNLQQKERNRIANSQNKEKKSR